MTEFEKPPMKSSNEAKPDQLEMAREQGQMYVKALKYMTQKEAHDGSEQKAGEYVIGYAVETAEGLYHYEDSKLVWVEPQKENVHVEVSVRDGADNRFIPGLTVHVTLLDKNGKEIGSHEQPFLWHPWLYHYGRNWEVPGDGEYKMRVRIEPPKFMRHDPKNGKRYAEPVEVEFPNVKIKTGQK